MGIQEDWPFDDPPQTAVITTGAVVRRHRPILLVTHDDDDGGWPFLDGSVVDEAEALLVGLSTIASLAPEIRELADLAAGWKAWRTAIGEHWRRSRSS